jgi:P27 family predicted phage terminase small subunit
MVNLDDMGCPSWFDERAQGEWQRVVTTLSKVPGLLASVDRSILISYCENYARWREAEARLEQEGKTVKVDAVEYPSPFVLISKTYHDEMMKAARELGFMPPEVKPMAKRDWPIVVSTKHEAWAWVSTDGRVLGFCDRSLEEMKKTCEPNEHIVRIFWEERTWTFHY